RWRFHRQFLLPAVVRNHLLFYTVELGFLLRGDIRFQAQIANALGLITGEYLVGVEEFQHTLATVHEIVESGLALFVIIAAFRHLAQIGDSEFKGWCLKASAD